MYICINPYSGTTFSGIPVNIGYADEVQVKGDFLCTPDGSTFCRIDSYNGHRHFADNSDNNGLERGAITYAIAFQTNFNDTQSQIVFETYSNYLQKDVLLFNNGFFKADIAILQGIAKDLGISYEIPPAPSTTFTVTPLKSASIQNIIPDSDTGISSIFTGTTVFSADTFDSGISSEVSLKQISDSLDTLIANSEVS